MPKADTVTIVDGRLIVDVALDNKGRVSSTGKTVLHFAHQGKLDGKTVGINVYSKAS